MHALPPHKFNMPIILVIQAVEAEKIFLTHYTFYFSKLLELRFLTHSTLHSLILLNSEAKIFNTLFYSLINPRCACEARVTVVVLCVCVCVCLSVPSKS